LGYTQSPPLTKEEIETLLKEAKIARFCTLDKDGTIHAMPVWFKYENGQIFVGTPAASHKARNVKRNNNVTVLIDVEGPPTKGVLIRGKAKMTNVSLADVVSLFEKYMPIDQAEKLAKGFLKMAKSVKITVKPERIVSFDYGRDTAYRNAHEG